MRLLDTCVMVAALLGVASGGCGGTDKTVSSGHQAANDRTGTLSHETTSASSSSPQGVDPDHDDYITEGYGQAASSVNEQMIATTVKRYYTMATAGDGVVACSMIVSSLADAIPEDYGRGAGPPGLRGNTCPVVMSKLFRQSHRKLTDEIATMVITKVRVSGSHALAFLRFKDNPEPRDISLEREGTAWKISGLLDNSLP